MARFRTRRFQPEDEIDVNECFLRIVRSKWGDYSRSIELMRWLWYHAPGGPMDSWVIETESRDGSWRIVGHHGLCPLRFTFGDLDLLCAKTVNTFLLPEFRSKFVYLRFERECLEEVGRRYDATYSSGSGSRRFREALGYEGTDTWICLEHGSRPFGYGALLFSHLVKKFPRTPLMQTARVWSRACELSAPNPTFEWIEYNSAEAIRSPFFADFWQDARIDAGMCPRRDVLDLSWRFWMRPEHSFVTLVHTWAGGGRAYCIVETSNPFLYTLLDIAVTPGRPDLLEVTLDALFAWCARRGALNIWFRTTTGGQPQKLMDVFSRRMRMYPLQPFRPRLQLLRHVSPKGRSVIGAPMPDWNATELLVPC